MLHSKIRNKRLRERLQDCLQQNNSGILFLPSHVSQITTVSLFTFFFVFQDSQSNRFYLLPNDGFMLVSLMFKIRHLHYHSTSHNIVRDSTITNFMSREMSESYEQLTVKRSSKLLNRQKIFL